MKRILFYAVTAATLTYISCNKSDNSSPGNTDDFATLEKTVLTDFTNNVAIAGYLDLDNKATVLNDAVQALNTTTNEANLTAARNAWKGIRTVWELSEGYLFGPVEDNEYDPQTDTWPTDYVQMDSLLASSNPLAISDLQQLDYSLRGYHPLEYILFGVDGNVPASGITARQKTYMVSLATDIKNVCHALYTSWIAAPTNFGQMVTTAGEGSTVYAKKQEVYIKIAEGMIGICEEVGRSSENTGKIYEPFIAKDSNIVESPYSENSMTDFKNNIIGAYNVYLGKYVTQGKGFTDLVKAKNTSLDNTIKQKFEAAISSFDNVTMSFEKAIFEQRTQLQTIMDKLSDLKTTLDEQLNPFVIQYIKD